MSVYSFPPQGSRIDDRAASPRDDLALVGLIFGIAGVLFGLLPLVLWVKHLLGIIGIVLEPLSLGIAGIFGVVGIILSLIAFIRTLRRRARHRTTALAGIATSAVSLALAVIGVAIIFAPVIEGGEDAIRSRSQPSFVAAMTVCSSARVHSSERAAGSPSVGSSASWVQGSARCTAAGSPTSASTTHSRGAGTSHGSGCASGCRRIQS